MALSSADVVSMQSALAETFLHRLVIERNTPGAADEYNHPAASWAQLAVVNGTVIPLSAEEVARVSEAGTVVSTHTILLSPTDIVEGDRIRHDKAACPITDSRDLAEATFDLVGIRVTAGTGVNLAIDARLVK